MKFRKRPIVIDAILFDGTNFDELARWSGGAVRPGVTIEPEVVVDTAEGKMAGRTGDWIIRGVKGEYYPCMPDVFAVTYELA